MLMIEFDRFDNKKKQKQYQLCHYVFMDILTF